MTFHQYNDILYHMNLVDIKKNYLGYNISTFDLEILEFIKTEICPNTKIYFNFTNATKIRKAARLRIYSKQILSDLSKLGIIENKTGKEILCDIPNIYKRDYLRGLFDGDGCIEFSRKEFGSKYNRCRFRIASASKEFLISIQKSLCNNLGNIRTLTNKNSFSYHLDIGGFSNLNNLYHILYDNNCFSLTRKKHIFTNLSNYYESTLSIC